jgi:hypothetical protein
MDGEQEADGARAATSSTLEHCQRHLRADNRLRSRLRLKAGFLSMNAVSLKIR